MKLKFKYGVILGVLSAFTFHLNSANACTTKAGYTCFGDTEKGTTSGVYYDNKDWAAFGWNDRADWFRNNGRYDDICLYVNKNYSGSKFCLIRGQSFYPGKGSAFRNSISSNRWVSYGC